MPANVTEIAGATEFDFYLGNYSYANISSSMAALRFKLCTNTDRLIHKNAAGTLVKEMADASGATNHPADRVLFTDSNGAAETSANLVWDSASSELQVNGGFTVGGINCNGTATVLNIPPLTTAASIYLTTDGSGVVNSRTAAQVLSDIDAAPSSHNHPWSDIMSAPTTLAGYGITDAYTETEVDGLFAAHEGAADPHPGYLTSAEGDAAYSAMGHTHTHASTTGKTADDHHDRDHDIDGATHTASGLTAGQILAATGATTFDMLTPSSPAGLTWDYSGGVRVGLTTDTPQFAGIGIGQGLSAWGSYAAVELVNGVSLYDDGTAGGVVRNAHRRSDGQWYRTTTGYAAKYMIEDDVHRFDFSPGGSGSAGVALSWTTALKVGPYYMDFNPSATPGTSARFRGSYLTSLLYLDGTNNRVAVGHESADVLLHLSEETATTAAAERLLKLTALSSGTVADGFGTGIEFELEQSLYAAGYTAGAIDCVWGDESAGDSDIVFYTADGLLMAEKMRLYGNGDLQLTSGDLGVGRYPTANLDIYSSTNATGILQAGGYAQLQLISNDGAANADSWRVIHGTNNELRFETFATGAWTSALVFDSSKNADFKGNIAAGGLPSGATQVAAGAAANELWVTSGHATLPDNVVMRGA